MRDTAREYFARGFKRGVSIGIVLGALAAVAGGALAIYLYA